MVARLVIAEFDTGATRTLLESDTLHFEAPNWSPDGEELFVNADGGLFRLPASPPPGFSVDDLLPVDLGDVPGINNDHVISPDGRFFYVSAHDGHLYEVPRDGGSSRRITSAHPEDRRFKHYLHGISPDGRTLSYIGGGLDDSGDWTTNVYTIRVDGTADTQLTDDAFPDDGAEFGPDGETIWFNSERGSSTPGHSQVFRMNLDGSGLRQLTDDERVNWFPHPSPDGSRVVYISFPPGTLGHPADHDVILRALDPESLEIRDIDSFNGGQGTINVSSWAPDSRRFAYVTY
ncbi:TolB family protein [Planctomonas psychrotolerans]|uniref:TolB family protein n=1 Tax=Planctomonas psychrotolerans TaxID=2528712 RepID=UPI001238D22A|nr:biopolymer transporter Tol [Planctomonas psychrotolerans]